MSKILLEYINIYFCFQLKVPVKKYLKMVSFEEFIEIIIIVIIQIQTAQNQTEGSWSCLMAVWFKVLSGGNEKKAKV